MRARRLLFPLLPVAVVAMPFVAGGLRSTREPELDRGQGTVQEAPRDLVPDVPSGVGNVDSLTPAMRRSVERALAEAHRQGVELRVTSGWRSREHQQRLWEDALRKYGSSEQARKWVLPPAESAHVLGQAIDVAPAEGARWLDVHGVRFGLCRRYANEPWHFERLAGAKGSTCPALEPHP